MSIRILHNNEDTMASMYESSTDWAFGPVVYTHGQSMSAGKLLEKFIQWAQLRRRGPFDDWSDAWMQSKWSEFYGMQWRECPDCCGDELVMSQQVRCEKCQNTCDECGDTDVETKAVSRPGKKTAKLCGVCEREASGAHV